MEERNSKPSAWMKGALSLSIAAFIAKGLSALYKVPYQNLTGDIGYYVYQQIYPLYGLIFVLGTYGFPMAISKMLAEKEESFLHKKKRMLVWFIALFILNGLIASSVIIFSEQIAHWMGDENLASPLRFLGLPFFLIPFLSISRGYFQSKGNMLPTSVSQVTEQIVRVVVILMIAWWASRLHSPYQAGMSAGLGAFAGGLAGILIMTKYWSQERSLMQQPESNKERGIALPVDWKTDVKELFLNGFLVSISAMTLIIFQIVDSFSVVKLLLSSGWEIEAGTVLKGIYDRGWPIIQLGAVVTTVFSYASIPYITKAKIEGDDEQLGILIKQSLRICLVFGGAAAVGLIAIMPHLNPMLFMDQLEVTTLSVLATSVLSGAIFMTAAALLHGIGKGSVAALILFAGVLFKGLGNAVLIPMLNIMGAAISTSIILLVMSICSLYALKKYTSIILFNRVFMWKWTSSLIGMGLVVVLYEKGAVFFTQMASLAVGRLFHSFVAVTSSLLGAIVFLILIWRLRLFNKEEWDELPKVSKLLPYKE